MVWTLCRHGPAGRGRAGQNTVGQGISGPKGQGGVHNLWTPTSSSRVQQWEEDRPSDLQAENTHTAAADGRR